VALSGSGGNTRVSEKTRQLVQKTAEKLNYRSNAGARSMRTHRFDNVGYFTVKKAPGDYAFAELILDGLSDGAAENGKNLMLVRIPDHSEHFEDIPKALREQCLDALVISETAAFTPGFQIAVEASGIPVIYLNEKQATNAVYVDDLLAARIMTEHLISQGFKRISHLAPLYYGDHYSFPERIAGYSHAMKAAGLEPDVKRYGADHWREEARDWVAGPGRPEAIFCYGDTVALHMQRILYRLGLRIPEDIALAGCNGEVLAWFSTVPLTTLEVPFRAMAASAFRMAIDLANDPERKPIPSKVFVPRLVASVSTARQQVRSDSAACA
jgi:LacI family transcriptional regulator